MYVMSVCNSEVMVCPSARGDNPRALAGGLSSVHCKNECMFTPKEVAALLPPLLV